MSLRNEIKTKEKIAISGAAISFIIFSLILYLSKFSVNSIVNIQNHILKTILLQTGGTNTFGAVYMLLSPFALVFLALIFFVLGFAFLSSYGYYSINKKIGAICGIIGAVFVIIFLNFSPVGILLALSLIICSIYVIPLSNTYGKELKKWIFFRVGSHSISKVLLITNILIALAIFLAIFYNLPVYENNFKSDIKDSMTTIALASIPNSQSLMYDNTTRQLLEQKVREQVDLSVNESPIFSAYVRWLPVTSAFTIWVLLEFLRGLILSNIGGLFTSGLLRFLRKKQ